MNEQPLLSRIDIQEYFNPIESDLIDDDIKKMVENKSVYTGEIIQMQLIKTMKELINEIKKLRKRK